MRYSNPAPRQRIAACGAIGVFSLAAASAAQEWAEPLTKKTFTSKEHGELPYRWFAPKDRAKRLLPLVLFLHGAGERGTDNARQLRHGVRDFVDPRAQQARPCFVAAPQCPRGQWWNVPHLVEFLGQLRQTEGVDTNRIYVTGLSMGGYGTWHLLGQRPQWIAAGVPICGGGKTDEAKAMARTPIWAFHGGADTVVPAKQSRDMIAAVRAAGGRPKYTEYDGVRHNSWSRTYSNSAVHEWLFAQRRKRRNVLFLIADDLGAQALGCYGNPDCKTPTIDALARNGVRFTRAYCQFPICGPSRAALMAGMYPQSIGVMGNGGAKRFSRNIGNRATMSGLFRRHGYDAIRVSKIYHMRVPGDITAGVHGPDHAPSWSERFSFRGPEWATKGQAEHLSNERLKFQENKHYSLGFGSAFYVVKGEGDGSEQADVQAADKAIELLARAKTREQPFFLAVGFVRPHVPLVAPASYYEPYPPAKMRLPKRIANDLDDIPRIGRTRISSLRGLTDDAKKRKVLAAYYASCAFLDAQIARVLRALKDHGHADDTIVVFTSDHGYHLGEHEFWQKMSLHEESARIPLILQGPGITPGETGALAQQIDIYPTLATLAGLPVPKHVEGKSLTPILANKQANVHDYVHCTTRKGQLIRTKDWAYLAWRSGDAELYDMAKDPKQFDNVAARPEHAATIKKLRQHLK